MGMIPVSKILVEGGPGTGKSTVLNALLDGNPYSQRFKAQNAANKTNVTLRVQVETNNYFNNKINPQCKGIDIPGLKDDKSSISDIINELVTFYLKGEKIDAGLILVKSTDNRLNFDQISAIKMLINIFKQVKPQSIWLCITHIDLIDVSQDFINQKLQAFKTYGLPINPNNIIKFNIKNPIDSLFPFVQRLLNQNQQSQMELIDKQNVNQAIYAYKQSLPQFQQKNVQIQKELSNLQDSTKKLQQQIQEEKQKRQQLYQNKNLDTYEKHVNFRKNIAVGGINNQTCINCASTNTYCANYKAKNKLNYFHTCNKCKSFAMYPMDHNYYIQCKPLICLEPENNDFVILIQSLNQIRSGQMCAKCGGKTSKTPYDARNKLKLIRCCRDCNFDYSPFVTASDY